MLVLTKITMVENTCLSNIERMKLNTTVYCLDDITVSGKILRINQTVEPALITFKCSVSEDEITKEVSLLTDDFNFVYRTLIQKNRELETDFNELRSSYWNVNQQLIKLKGN